MQIRVKSAIAAAVMAVSVMGWASAEASTVVTIASVDPSSSHSGDWGAQYAIDGASNTDWAVNETGTGYLDITLSKAYDLAKVTVTDRLTSGGSNGGYVGGIYDFTTQYTLQAYTDASFTTTLGAAYTFTVGTPATPGGGDCCSSDPSAFVSSQSIAGLDGQYVRYTIDASRGSNPGLSNISFAAVPEPAAWAMMIGGLFLIGGSMRSRKASDAAAAA